MARRLTLLPADVRPFLSPTEAAELVGVSRATIIRRIENGELEALQTQPVRGRYRIPRASLERYLDSLRTR